MGLGGGPTSHVSFEQIIWHLVYNSVLFFIFFYNLIMIFVIALILFYIDNLFDSSPRYTLLPHLTLIFFFSFIIRLMCFSIIIVAYFLVPLD